MEATSSTSSGRPDNASAVETTLELTYLAPITSWLSIQPDVQYVFDPSTKPG